MSPREVRCGCGAINDVTFRTCIRCGEPLGASNGQPAPKRRPPPRREEAAGRPLGRAALILGGLCSFVFAIQLSFALKQGQLPVLGLGGISPRDALRSGILLPAVEYLWMRPYWAEPLRVVSANFAHFGLFHFGMNMFGFASLARTSEALVGTSRTIIAFVGTGVFGFAATVAVHEIVGGPLGPTAGASAGILGVMGLLIGVLIRRKNEAWKNLAIQTAFFGVLVGFAVNASSAGFRINNTAHIGGLVCGLLLGLAWGRTGTKETTLTKGLGIAFIVLSVLSIVVALGELGPLPRGLGV